MVPVLVGWIALLVPVLELDPKSTESGFGLSPKVTDSDISETSISHLS